MEEREGTGLRRRASGDWGRVSPRAEFCVAAVKRKKGVRRGQHVSPTDPWTTGPIGHGLLRCYYSFKQVEKVLTASNGHR